MTKLRVLYRILTTAALVVHVFLLTHALRFGLFASGRVLFVIDTRTAMVLSFLVIFLLHVIGLLTDHLDPGAPIRRDLFSGVLLVAVELLLVHIFVQTEFYVVVLIVCFLAFTAIHYTPLVLGVLYGIAVPSVWAIASLAGRELYIAVVAALPPLAWGVAYAMRALVGELNWERESADRARYTATEFVRMNLRLQHTASVGEMKGRQRERMRLAREIHDTVGHALTAILMQTRLVRTTLRDVESSHPDVCQELENLEELSRATIEDVRREVSSLRERAKVRLSWLVRWRALCRSFADSTGTTVIASIPDIAAPITDELGESVFRILQESLTNAIRHGRASVVDVRMLVKSRENRLYVRVSDNGRGSKTVAPGNGLSGIRERVESLHGDVAWETLPNRGFDLGVDLPLRNGHEWNVRANS